MSIFTFSNAQKILASLANHPVQTFSVREIQTKTGLSKPGIHTALRQLAKEKLVTKEKKSNLFLFSVNHSDPVVKQYKVLLTIGLLQNLVSRLKQHAKRVILFGSAARGEDTPESDIDLLVVTTTPEHIAVRSDQKLTKRKLQLIVRTPVQYEEMAAKEKVFFDEANRGIILWEEQD